MADIDIVKEVINLAGDLSKKIIIKSPDDILKDCLRLSVAAIILNRQIHKSPEIYDLEKYRRLQNLLKQAIGDD